MKRIAVIGGETHIGEVTKLKEKSLDIVGASVRPGLEEWAGKTFGCSLFDDPKEMLEQSKPDIVAVANENDEKSKAVLLALKAGCDVVVDKPIALSTKQQASIERELWLRPEQRLLMLLTLRGQPIWAALREIVRSGRIGIPAFTHVRMAVRLKRAERPPWFLDVRRSGGVFLDLLIHGLDQVEWITGRRIAAMTARTGNLSDPADRNLRDHASVFCELDDGSSAVVEGQRTLPDVKGSDYRVTVAATEGYADLFQADNRLNVTDGTAADKPVEMFPDAVSVVQDWLNSGDLVGQKASLRANLLAVTATEAADSHRRVAVPGA